MILSKTPMGDKNDRQMSSTQLDSHPNMVVVGKQEWIMQRSGENIDV